MGGDIHSMQFYQLMALAYADAGIRNVDGSMRGNINGGLDSKEGKDFYEYFNRFEKDNEPGISEQDISEYTKEVTYTKEEINNLNRMYELEDLSFERKLSADEEAELKKLSDRHFEMLCNGKIHNVHSFLGQAKGTIEYLRRLNEKGLLEELEIEGQRLNLSIDDINAYARALEQEEHFKVNG